MKKKVLITGAAGMIGSHLLDALIEKGYAVTGLDNLKVGKPANIKHNLKNFKFIKGDVLDKGCVERAAKGAGIIVHLAASKKIGEDGDALETLVVNVEGTRNVLEAAKRCGAKVIFASTSDVYGISKDVPFREDGELVVGPPTAKRWAYAVSKICAEQLVFAYHKEHHVPVVILRYFGGFSPRSNFAWSGGHIPLFIKAVLTGREVLIHGDGTQTRSMAYVDDIVRGTVLAMENPKAVGEIFNIGNDEELSVIKSARLIHSIAGRGRKLRIRFVPHKKIFGSYEEIRRRRPSLSKAKRMLGYEPKVSLKKGIELTCRGFKSY